MPAPVSMFQRLAVHSTCSTGSCPCTSARKPSTGRLRCRRIVSGEASRPRSTSSASEGAAVPNRRSDSAHEWCGASACTIPTGPCTVAIVIASGMLPSAARQRGYPGYFRMGTPLFGLENRVGTIGSASATPPGRANLRRMVAFVFVRPPRCRHGFARSRHALTPTASGLMTARPPRQRRSSSESPRERKMGSAIVCGMGRCRAATAEVHNHRQRMSESDTRSGCPVVRRCPALEFRRAFRCRGYCLPPTPRVAAARTFPCVRVCSNGLQLSVRGRGVKRLTDRPTNQRRSSVSSRPDPIPRVRESKMKRIPPPPSSCTRH